MNVFYYEEEGISIRHGISYNPMDEQYPMHAHDDIEIYYFVSGSCKYLVEGSEYYLKPGDILLMRPSETHNLCVLENVPYERVVMNVSPNIITEYDPDGFLLKPINDRPLGKFNQYRAEDFPSELYKLCFECFDGKSVLGDRLESRSKLFVVLGEIYKAYVARTEVKRSETAVQVSDNAVKIISYINDHLFEPLSLKSISEYFFMSQSQLNRVFHKATGSPVWEYITIKRLIAARNNIQSGTPAGKVCTMCGFKDYSSFYRLYKTRFGISPKQDCKKTK